MTLEEREPRPATPGDASGKVSCPRLGLIHLLVWTACVAVCLGLQRVLVQIAWGPAYTLEDAPLKIATAALRSIGYGAALAGLLLWVARRRRGLRFPKHPGEYLLVVLGLDWALTFFAGFLTLPPSFPLAQERLPLLLAPLCGQRVLYVIVLLWPLLAVKSLRWRMFFGAMLASQLLFVSYLALSQLILHLALPRSQPTWVLRWSGIFTGLILGFAWLSVAADAILVVIVAREHWKGIRYPWTHWAGVAVRLWLALIGIGPTVIGSIALLRTML
jgi:hypothetical protein